MLTLKQKKWIDHLSESNKIVIKPYDSTAPEKFEKVKARIQKVLGEKIKVEHCGATALKISGQDEIDIYIPVSPKDFGKLLIPLEKFFGEPKSLYPLERARFVTIEGGKRVDIFLINKDDDDWKNGVRFETYLKTHSKALDEYRKLKENGNGLSVREYYRRKINFINKILTY